jgi:hypothetical protein
MTLSKLIRCAMLLAGFFTISQTAFAQGTVIDNSETTAELGMSATAQTALTLDISTNGGASVSGAAGSGEFTINLGNVNGLGVGTPASGVSVAVNGSGATYTTPITLTPIFSGFSAANATITVERSATGGNALGDDAVREGATSSVSAVTGTATNVTSSATSTTPITRYVGFFVSNANGSGYVEGALSSTLVYTITATP